MNNLQNNKRYKIVNNINLLVALLSIVSAVLRVILPNFTQKVFAFSSYVSWYAFNVGYSRYQAVNSSRSLAIAIITLVILVMPYFIWWALAKKRLAFMICGTINFCIDTLLLAIDVFMLYNYNIYLTLGVVFKIVIIAIMLIGIYYGFIGRSVEISDDEDDLIPNTKFTNDNYNVELAKKQKRIVIKRQKDFLCNYIYLQCYVDNEHYCYLKNGEEQELILDDNLHRITIVGHFEKIKPVRIKITQGEENPTYIISIKRKYLIFKTLNILKEDNKS